MWRKALLFSFVYRQVNGALYQAETATLFGCRIKNDNNGYTGQGYVDYGERGSFVEWDVDVATAGLHSITVRYATPNNRPVELRVDGADYSAGNFEFVSTGAWTNWQTETFSIAIDSGRHQLKIFAAASPGPNIDWLEMAPMDVSRQVQTMIMNPNDFLLIMKPNDFLLRGSYLKSSQGTFEFGLSDEGYLEIRGNSEKYWSSRMFGEQLFPGIIFYCQDDGNLVLKDSVGRVVFVSNTAGNTGAELFLSESGTVSLIRNGQSLWDRAAVVNSPNNNTSKRTLVLGPRKFLARNEFVASPSGRYSVGIDERGAFVLLDNELSQLIWSAGIVGGQRAFMQRDGNFVVRDRLFRAMFDTDTDGNFGAQLEISDSGSLGIFLEGVEIWSSKSLSTAKAPVPFLTASPQIQPTFVPLPIPTSSPQAIPTIAPQVAPTRGPQPMPTSAPQIVTIMPTISRVGDMPALTPQKPSLIFDQAEVLRGGYFLEIGDFMRSPNGAYRVGLNRVGTLVLLDKASDIIWQSQQVGGFRCFMQNDGNLIVRDVRGRALWNSRTSGNDGSRFIIDDGGMIAIMHGTVPIWIAGVPRGTYQTSSASQDLQFPIRGAFYYPWFPETWTVNGKIARFEPDLGFYSSGNPVVAEEHIEALEWAWVDLSIASWFGPDTNLDRARLTLLLDKTLALDSSIKWTVYHEMERFEDESPEMIQRDLEYLKEWFAWHPAWARIDGRPVIFVYNEDGCEVVDRWMRAGGGEWYIVLKLFRGFLECAVQPDSWHQYGPADPVVHIENHSYSISPGFWRADIAEPRLPRLSEQEFCENTASMVASGESWQLITTFNEAGEGTMVEASRSWSSTTKYGYYLDCLHTHY